MTAADAKLAAVSEAAGLLALWVGAWNHFGYDDPRDGETAIPPLGERSADAIKAGHDAVGVIDEIIRDLHSLRSQLVTELRTNEDKLGRRVDATLAAHRETGGPA